MKRFLAFLVCTLLWAASANAQTCTGGVPFGTARFQVGGDGAFSSNSHSFFAGAGAGNATYWGRAGVQFTGFSQSDSSAKGVIGSAGAEYPVDSQKRVYVCPMVTVFHLWGPNYDISTSSSTVFSLGGGVGFVAANTGQATIVPTFGLRFDHISSSSDFTEPFAITYSASTSYGDATFGAGIILNDRMAIIPLILVPFHYAQGETVFSVLFAAKIGQ